MGVRGVKASPCRCSVQGLVVTYATRNSPCILKRVAVSCPQLLDVTVASLDSRGVGTQQRREGPRERAVRTGTEVLDARWAVLHPKVRTRKDRVFRPDQCANCMDPLPADERGLFCSDWCQETTKDVRWMRRAAREGRVEKDPETAQALVVRVDFLYRGGYKRLDRNVAPATRVLVVERSGGLCDVCGLPARDLDHIAGSSGGADNLQLLCATCHQAKTNASLGTALAAEGEEGEPWFEALPPVLQSMIIRRVFGDPPLVLADDEDEWPGSWSRLRSERRRRLALAEPNSTL